MAIQHWLGILSERWFGPSFVDCAADYLTSVMHAGPGSELGLAISAIVLTPSD